MNLKFLIVVLLPLLRLVEADACTPEISNCKSCASLTLDTCETCEDNFTQKGKYCCKSDCEECDSESKCSKCSDTFKKHGSDCVSACPVGTFENENECIDKCPDGKFGKVDKCETCFSKCSKCSEESSCEKCEGSYFPNGSQCSECSKNCALCTDSTTCSECKNGYKLKDNACVKECVQGEYYDAINDLCSTCSKDCKECESSNSHCVSCQDGKYLESNACQTCKAGCNKCNDASTCSVCISGKKLNNSECIDKCPVDKFDNKDICVDSCPNFSTEELSCVESCSPQTYKEGKICKKCKTELDCKTCDVDKCLTCDSTRFLDDIKCVSSCSKGKYPDSGVCKQCIENCEECSSSTNCSKCKDPFTFNGSTNKCELADCKEGEYKSGTDCKKCVIGCKKCTNETECDECLPDFISNDAKKCDCKEGSYLQGDNTCKKCIEGCKQCTNDTECGDCFTGYKLQSKICVKEITCKEGEYIDANECKKCTLGCKKCSNDTDCEECNPTFVKDSNKCACKEGDFLQGDVCSQCIKGCKQCSKDTECEVCLTNYKIQDNKTCLEIKVCDEGQFLEISSNDCQQCSVGCKKCSSATECQECLADFKLDSKKCICKDGFYLQTPFNQCKNCIQFCSQCSTDSDCQKCQDGYNYTSNKCQVIVDCKENEFTNSKGQCQSCSSGCKKCDNEKTCNECMDSYYKDKDKCVKSCGDGKFLQNKECVVCTPQNNCKTCENATSCLSCNSGFEKKNNICSQQCSKGEYLEGNTCQECEKDLNCLTCSNNSSCDSCATGFKYIKSSKQCVSSCDSGMNLYIDFNEQGQCIDCTAKISSKRDFCVSKCSDLLELEDGDGCKDKCPSSQDKVISTKDGQITVQCKDKQTGTNVLVQQAQNIKQIMQDVAVQIKEQSVIDTYSEQISKVFSDVSKNLKDLSSSPSTGNISTKNDLQNSFINVVQAASHLSSKSDLSGDKPIKFESEDNKIISQKVSTNRVTRRQFKLEEFEKDISAVVLTIEQSSSSVQENIKSLTLGYQKINFSCKDLCFKASSFIQLSVIKGQQPEQKRILEDSTSPGINEFSIVFPLPQGANPKQYACASIENDKQVAASGQTYLKESNSISCFVKENVFVIYDPDCKYHNKLECSEPVIAQVGLIVGLTVGAILILCIGYCTNEMCKFQPEPYDKQVLLNMTQNQQQINIDLPHYSGSDKNA